MRLTTSVRSGAFAEALSLPYPKLVAAGLRPRRGQLSLTVAASGVGKSQLWANIAHRMQAPTLFWSADTDRHDVTTRALALWSGYTIDQVADYRQLPDMAEWMNECLANARHIDWEFDNEITGPRVIQRVEAFGEKFGEYPHLIVIDNLSNTVSDIADEFVQQKQVVTALQGLARDSMAHIAMLHHAKGEYESGTKPIPKSGVLNNLLKLPEQGITLHAHGESALGVCVVKNRSGVSDPAAQYPVIMPVDFSRAAVLGYEQ